MNGTSIRVLLDIKNEKSISGICKESDNSEELILNPVYILLGLYYQYDRQTRMECTFSCCIQETTKCRLISFEAWS